MDSADAKVLSDVATCGWHMITVSEDAVGPGFTYSIGLFKSYGHPEVVVFGLPNDAMQRIVDIIATLVKAGRSFGDGDQTPDVLEGYSCAFRAVRLEHYKQHFGYAMWFYKGTAFSALQCLWPDNEHHFPWQPQCQAGIRRLQPALYEPTALEQAPSSNEPAR
jgi:hypothetical protein